MSNISEVIGWKFDHMEGMSTRGNGIVEFPAGVPGVTYDVSGIPVQSDQDAWTADYQVYEVKRDLLLAIDQETKDHSAIGYEQDVLGTVHRFSLAALFLERIRQDSQADKAKTFTVDAYDTVAGTEVVLDLVKQDFKDLEQNINLYLSDFEDLQREQRRDVYAMDFWDVHVPTSVVAGSPGIFGPSPSNFRDFAALNSSGLAPIPNSNWTAGQHVILADSTHAHWTLGVWNVGDTP